MRLLPLSLLLVLATSSTCPRLHWHDLHDPDHPPAAAAPPESTAAAPESAPSGGSSLVDWAAESSGSKVINASTGMQFADHLLLSSKDRYMMVPCATPVKWVVIHLSEDINIRQISISNLEHYSSGFQNLQFLGSHAYPTKRWALLANASLLNSRGSQDILVRDQVWIRYLKIRFLSHHGSEFWCTMTSVSVFGPRLLESLDDIHKPSPLAAEPSSGDKPPRPAVDRLSSPDLDPAAPATAPTQSAVEDAAGFKGKSVFETLGIRIRLLEESQKKVDLQLKDRLSLALFQIHQWVAGIEDAMAAELEELAVSVRKSLGDAEQAAADLGDGLDVLEEVFVVVADLRNLLKVTEALVLGLLAAFAMTFAVAVFVLAVAFKPAERGVGTKRSLYRKRSRFGASR